jgi:hypothetical protein
MGRFPSAVSYVLAFGAGLPDRVLRSFRPAISILGFALMSAIVFGFFGPVTSDSDPLASATICRESNSNWSPSDASR